METILYILLLMWLSFLIGYIVSATNIIEK
jgi:hypothetical protein